MRISQNSDDKTVTVEFCCGVDVIFSQKEVKQLQTFLNKYVIDL